MGLCDGEDAAPVNKDVNASAAVQEHEEDENEDETNINEVTIEEHIAALKVKR